MKLDKITNKRKITTDHVGFTQTVKQETSALVRWVTSDEFRLKRLHTSILSNKLTYGQVKG